MPPPPKQVFWQRFRRYFRWCRITLLLFVLLFLGSLVYLNRVGLPEFLKARLVSELRARGVVLQFTRMRLRWYHGLVAENVSLGPADEPTGRRCINCISRSNHSRSMMAGWSCPWSPPTKRPNSSW